jgi:bifunctional N-acetylglucosamine-1-phosphate-uridyltransferase/glucosamine-1-phosphate-acetyltransferase GlmU-like protein
MSAMNCVVSDISLSNNISAHQLSSHEDYHIKARLTVGVFAYVGNPRRITEANHCASRQRDVALRQRN